MHGQRGGDEPGCGGDPAGAAAAVGGIWNRYKRKGGLGQRRTEKGSMFIYTHLPRDGYMCKNASREGHLSNCQFEKPVLSVVFVWVLSDQTNHAI